MQVKGAVLHEVGALQPYQKTQPLTIESLHLSPPGEGEVLVKIAAAGICHSDLSVINGNRPRPTPMLLGHEASGIVESLGSGVHDLKVGDHVVMAFVPSCGACSPCMTGRPALCEPGAKANNEGTLLSGRQRLQLKNNDVYHHLGVSAFAEYAVVSRRSLVAIDKSLPLDEAALFGCAVMTGVGAVINTARVAAGTQVAVIGLGGVGLNALLGAQVAGAKQIVAIDLHEDKLDLARELGATDVFNAGDDDCVEQIRDATNGGVDYALEMAGSVHAMDLAYRITKRGGMTVSAGLSHPDHQFCLQHVNLVAEERTVKGSYIGSCVPVRDIPRYIDLYQAGKLPVNRLMSASIRLEDINTAFDQLASGHTARQIIVFD